MENSGGIFDVPIGQGTVVYPTTGSFSVLDAFNNSGSFTCQGGAPYAASINDSRKLRVQFHDGIGWKLISPDSVIRSVPFAGYATALSTITAGSGVTMTNAAGSITIAATGGGGGTTWTTKIANYTAVAGDHILADRNPSISLTNNNRTAQTSAGWAMIRAISSQSSGKYYFEIKVDQLSGNGNALMVGLADANASLSSSGSSRNEIAQASGWSYNGLAGSWSGTNPQWQVGDIIGVAVDFSGKTMKIYRNNVNTSTFTATALSGYVLFPAL